MAFRIVRNDITKMNTEAIVNTANEYVTVGSGCDTAVYTAAGFDELLAYRKEKVGYVPEGEVFITPGFLLAAKYIIHAVSPLYRGGMEGDEEKLRSCYRKSLKLAKEKGIRSIAFPLISTGSFGYPKEEGMRIAADEINAFLLNNEMEVFLVVFDDRAKELGEKIYPGLEEYIDKNYVEQKHREESAMLFGGLRSAFKDRRKERSAADRTGAAHIAGGMPAAAKMAGAIPYEAADETAYIDFESEHESRLEERISHISDTFSQYLLYLIKEKNMENAEVYKRAIVDKKIFSKIKNNVDYHPQKLTALCLCVGAKLNLDESKDLLARAGYALSPADKTDIIFSYFIENEIYDMIELDIKLEEHGLPCIIS
ncbi:MAG: macro domain-containing protein [Lachnospiraceae bacterium]|nr:macro domain-containing protein [Lachnospiraceae bacterium]